MSAIEGVALVTGGGAGLGQACAMTLGGRGARVAVHYLKSRTGAEDVVAALAAAGVEAALFQGTGQVVDAFGYTPVFLAAGMMGPLGLAVTLWLAGRIHQVDIAPRGQIA